VQNRDISDTDRCAIPRERTGLVSRPRLGVLATHAIQYQAPLYQLLALRQSIDLSVAFLSAKGNTHHYEPDFASEVTWDIDLLAGYSSKLLDGKGISAATWPWRLIEWIRRQDVVVVHGYSEPAMLFAAAACRCFRIPYLMRGDSQAVSTASGARRLARDLLASFTVGGAYGALTIGELNRRFYCSYGDLPLYSAPYSVDNDRFRRTASSARSHRNERLNSLGLDTRLPVAIFSGKLIPRKRPLDAVRAVAKCHGKFNLLILGDGPLRKDIAGFEDSLPVRCLGFVNQSELPRWYACGEILVLPSSREPWGLVVNEGMACGLLPVVSSAVGAAPDLVEGLGEVFPVGDIDALAAALERASTRHPRSQEAIKARLDHFTVASTAAGYEEATLAACDLRGSKRTKGVSA